MRTSDLMKAEDAYRRILNKVATSPEPDPVIRWVQVVAANTEDAARALMYAVSKGVL